MRVVLIIHFGIALCFSVFSQPKEANYDESKVPDYSLPDLLVTSSGEPVKTISDWEVV